MRITWRAKKCKFEAGEGSEDFAMFAKLYELTGATRRHKLGKLQNNVKNTTAGLGQALGE